jgi:hypothetical protein
MAKKKNTKEVTEEENIKVEVGAAEVAQDDNTDGDVKCSNPYKNSLTLNANNVSIQELVAYNSAVDVIFNYYDNILKATQSDFQSQAPTYRTTLEKYRRFKMNLLKEMEI